MQKHEKKRIKAEHLRQKVMKTTKKITLLRDEVPPGKDGADLAIWIAQSLSNKHLKRLCNHSEMFDMIMLIMGDDFMRLANDELILRTLKIVKE